MIDVNFFDDKKKLHFIGIGGSGMFPIVQIMHGKGFEITGSDNNDGDTIELERKMGIKISIGHAAEYVKGADAVIYSAAIMQDNPEIVAAKENGIPLVKRSQALGYITRSHDRCICVAGTHGKTTTTAMLTHMLIKAGKDPSAVIGGKLPLIGGNGLSGNSGIMTCEADEYSDTFLQLFPDIALILNVDADHLEYFKSLDNIKKSFNKFASAATKCLIVNGDDANTMDAVNGIDKEIITFGFSESNDYYPGYIETVKPIGSRFKLMHKGGALCDIKLNVVGRHNIVNAVAACICAMHTGVTADELPEAISGFKGAGRRFEILGEGKGITVADDYAHHPAELTVTLEAAKTLGYNKVWAVFQPFTYSRTSILLDDFATSLSIADRVVMSEIMGAREHNTYNIYTKDLAEKIPGSVWFNTFEEIADHVAANASPGDLVITLGCGDIYKCAKMIVGRLR